MNKNTGKRSYDETIPFTTPTNGMTQFIQQALISFFVLVTVLENILRSKIAAFPRGERRNWTTSTHT